MDQEKNCKTRGVVSKNYVTTKVGIIALIIIVLIIPKALIVSLVKERESRNKSVIDEISQKWGNNQTIIGPFFSIPYKHTYKDDKGALRSEIRYITLLPEKLNIDGTLEPQVRYRGIYKAVLYASQITIDGQFKVPSLSQLNIPPENINWDEASLGVGISDIRGLQNNIEILFNNKKYLTSPGLITKDIASSGVNAPIPLSASGTHSFSLDINLNGSQQINFVPAAIETDVSISSAWPSPSFDGAFLPKSREITDKGFSAAWKILHYNLNYPQIWANSQHNVLSSSFGLKLLLTTDIYQKSNRVAKYSIMFILFTFSAFFFTEIMNKGKFHPIQYILIGLAILLFYTLLLSLSEHIGFDWGYILAAAAITTLICLYSSWSVKDKKFTLTVAAMLTILYLYFYIVLQLEDYALLMGSIGLFVLLGTIMYITRNVDWYVAENSQEANRGEQPPNN